MTELPANPVPRYRVSYSERVRIGIRKLATVATERGRGAEFLAALTEIDRRLHVYPQFGQPLRDLAIKPMQLWLGTIPPLVVHYVLNEEKRLVIVGVPLKPLPRSGLE
jgi:hypothetical protein